MRISDWSSDVCSSDLGGDAPISVQTMTNTATADAAATIRQIRAAEIAGVDIVRVSCPDRESPAALKEIRSEERRVGNECVRTCISRWSAYHNKNKMT